MDGKVLVTETKPLTNLQNISDSRKPLKWGFFMSEFDLSELCQKKTGFLEFLHSQGIHRSIEKTDDVRWCVRQDLNLQPSDPKLNFRAYQRVSSGITNRLRPIDFIGQNAVSGSAPEAYQNRPGAAQIAAQSGQRPQFNS